MAEIATNSENDKKLTPEQYFAILKDSKKRITNEDLKNSYNLYIKFAQKYKDSGQTESMKKLLFLADTMCKEEKLIEKGINIFVYRQVIQDYVNSVSDKSVKIIELSKYMRELPDEIVETVKNTKDIFDNMYVVFTDYTGEVERQIEKERRDKDPILFGVFKNNGYVCDRFYFLGDWIDEYCDLTLDKMIDQYQQKKGVNPAMEIDMPTTAEELVEILKSYKEVKDKDNVLSYNLIDSIDASKISTRDVIEANNVKVNYFEKMPQKLGEETSKKSFFDKVRGVFKPKQKYSKI